MSLTNTSPPDAASSPLKFPLLRWAELTLLFVVFPIGLYFVRQEFSRWIVPTLLVTATVCTAVLLRDKGFERKCLGLGPDGWQGLKSQLRSIGLSFIPGALILSAAVAVFRPDLLFSFPKREPFWWMVVMIAYPLLSVYPQEILFRTFFFHRYRPILGSRHGAILWSAFVFGLAHLFFANWIAPTLTALGGYLFARTYTRSGSTLAAVIEHALWGDFLFTIGLGWYFYGGSIRNMAQAAGS